VTSRPGLGRSPVHGVPAARVTVVVAAGHALMRRGLRLLLEADDDADVVAEACDLPTAISAACDHLPDVLVIDLGMSTGSSIDAIRLLRRQAPETGIVVITTNASLTVCRAVLDAGALGFVLTQAAESELSDAVRSTARGDRYVSPRLEPRR
jgi:DNA-binding NarL/FixJ family response regulator